MPKVNDREIFEQRPWLNDDVQNREYLNKIVNGGGGGSVTVEPVTFTENGTYTADAGKAWSPVTVNVTGGSSDFSTATVTVTNLPSELYAPCTKDNEYFNGSDFTITTDGTFTVILYKGKAIAEAPNEDFTVSGDIEVDGTDMIITGDGTITFS